MVARARRHRRVLQEILRATGPSDDLVAELRTGRARTASMEIINNEVNAVPAAGLRLFAVIDRPAELFGPLAASDFVPT